MKTFLRILIFPMIFWGFVLMLTTGCGKCDDNNGIHRGTGVYTTLDRTIIPDVATTPPIIPVNDPADFAKYGYGKWHYGPGLPCQKRLDLMPAGYGTKSVQPAARLLRFFTITDIHITDKESPCQAIVFAPMAGSLGISCYSPLMLYTTQMLDATIRTVNGLHKQDPIDFGLALGDLGNSMQYNELRWFIDVMDGKTIKPYSGGPKHGVNNHYQDEFQAAGLDPSIPWYATLGNHDHFWMGTKPLNSKVQNALIGDSILRLGNIFTDPDAMNGSKYSVGTLDGSTQYGTIIGAGKADTMGTIPTITPDPDRHAILTITDWINEFNKSTSLPAGHGFVQSEQANVFGACYSFKPKSNLPLRVIVLDNTQDASEAPYEEGIYGHGELNNGRYTWLMNQLQAGQDLNELMIISAHIPIGVEPNGSPMDWEPASGYTDQNDLINQLRAFPNLILWVAGHRHLNNVTAFRSTDPTHPENSFWEVETKSLREFPEQFRTFDIVLNSDTTISIITTNVDPAIEEGSLAAIGRSYAIASAQIYGVQWEPLETGSESYNAELVKQLSPAMKERMKKK
jgi:metallophosphoesterase (TIGR03768 family)